jgi:nicotinamide mononucleotide adenylyltransferase
MTYNYEEDTKQYNSIVQRYSNLSENDITGAFKLMKDSLLVFNRWSYIRAEYRKELKRGEKTEQKDKLEDMLRFLKEVHTDSRMLWKNAIEELRNKVVE